MITPIVALWVDGPVPILSKVAPPRFARSQMTEPDSFLDFLGEPRMTVSQAAHHFAMEPINL